MEKTEKKLTVNAKLAIIKKELSNSKIPKSGHNKFAGFKYHELSDFIGIINNLNAEHGVNDICEIDEVSRECRLTLINVDNSEDREVIKIPFREAEMLGKGGTPTKVDAIQRMGSTITYNRRYLYMTAYNIQENDSVDSLKQPENDKPQKPLNKEDLEKLASTLIAIEDVNKLTKLYNSDPRYKTNKEAVDLFKNRHIEIK